MNTLTLGLIGIATFALAAYAGRSRANAAGARPGAIPATQGRPLPAPAAARVEQRVAITATLQQQLVALGYPLAVDGAAGPATQAALARFAATPAGAAALARYAAVVRDDRAYAYAVDDAFRALRRLPAATGPVA